MNVSQSVILRPKAEESHTHIKGVRSFTAFRMTIILLLAISYWLLAAPAALATHGGYHVLPVPGETCADDTCRKQICPSKPIERKCVKGKCVVQGGNPETETLPCNYTLDDLVIAGINMTNIVLGITGSLMLMFIAYGGYTMFTSLGNPEEIQKGRKILTHAFIGAIIIIIAGLLVRWIGDLVGAQIGGTPELGRVEFPAP